MDEGKVIQYTTFTPSHYRKFIQILMLSRFFFLSAVHEHVDRHVHCAFYTSIVHAQIAHVQYEVHI